MAGQGERDDLRPRDLESARRLGETLLRTAGELGYHRTTVGDILERSGESRERFHERFSSKEECFTAAYEKVAGELSERMLAAGRSGATWSQGLTRALAELLDFVAAQPALASALIVEVTAVKSAASIHDEIFSRLAEALDSARKEPGARARIPATMAPLLVAGLEGYLRELLLRKEPDQAPKVLREFVFLFVLYYFDEPAAFEAMDAARDSR
jgi:AcrR family transcriptional regulator